MSDPSWIKLKTNLCRAAASGLLAVMISACVPTVDAEKAGLTADARLSATAQETRPNILVLFVDDLAWMDVGYRSDFIETPYLDEWRKTTVSFERAYAPAPVCSPSRVGLITGQHPARHDFFRHVGADGKENFSPQGVPNKEFHKTKKDPAQMPSRNWLPLEAVTVAERLKDVGYHTAFVGKWHIGHEPYHPIHQGFDEQYGVTNFGAPNAGYYPPYWRARSDMYRDAPEDKFLTERITDDVLNILERESQTDDPLFLSVWYYGVHKPISGHRQLVQKYLDRGISQEQAEYASMVEAIDQSLARIDAKLAETGMADDTIVVFTSDQGGFFARDPYRGKKSGGEALFEGGARVPLYVRWPDMAPSSAEVSMAVSLLDVAPTILSQTGADLSDLDGTDLATRLATPDAVGDPVILYRHYEDRYAAVILDGWKLIATVSGNHELYDLSRDTKEANNVFADNPAKAEELLNILEAWKVEKNIRRF